MKDDVNYYRIRSVYCYDILEHPDYFKTKKIIKRMRKLKHHNKNFTIDVIK